MRQRHRHEEEEGKSGEEDVGPTPGYVVYIDEGRQIPGFEDGG